ncbi:MAG: cytochrome b/b6 domain-containing protein [Candidatus Marinimicrobia bacterium]|nr:cytochrome b/b6 domain-containing protein [Candidatus Neomarinimicrobiota bacterium]
MVNKSNHIERTKEWKHKLLLVISGLLFFETLTGLFIYLLPFSISNQVMVILHTMIGLVFILPFTWYQVRHWVIYRSMKMHNIKLSGYLSLIVTVVAVVTGLVLTFQAVFLTKISYGWDLIHIISTFALIATLLPHLIVVIIRDYKDRLREGLQPVRKAQKQYGLHSLFTTGTLFAITALLVYAYEPIKLMDKFPNDYSYLYGEDRPFAPSLAQTGSGGAYDSRSLGGSQSCGTSGCHEEIVKEWETSAHRYSSMDPAFQVVQKVMAEQNGPESTRYCGGCHDPISLFSGTKNIFTEELTNLIGYQEGVSCIICHRIKETDVKGNASYVVSQPKRYMFELHEGKTAQVIKDFLIRAYPKYHVESLQHRLFKSPEFCAACHKQFIDQEINQVGWVQLQNQYDNWRKSRWNHPGDPTKTIECRECHMPLIDSQDPSSGDPLDYNRSVDDKKHRSHRFLGANQFIPQLLDLPGASEHIALTEKWLQGKIEIPEIEDKWKTGPAVPLELVVPEKVTFGQEVNIQAMIVNNKVGHDFPTGPMDIIQAWVELIVKDQNGNEVFSSGLVDDRNFIQPGSFIFKAESVDQYGNLIDRHNLWEMVGVRYRRVLFPGFSDKAEFAFSCPGNVSSDGEQSDTKDEFQFQVSDNQITELHISAKLLYRKIDQFLLNFLLGEESGVTAPISVISEDQKIIEVVSIEKL